MSAAHTKACRGWARAVDEAQLGKREGDVQFLTSTPAALVDMGVPALPWFHSYEHLTKEQRPKDPSGGHALTKQLLCNLPTLLESPVAVWRDGRYPTRLLIALRTLDADGLPVVAVIDTAAAVLIAAERVACVYLVTVYGHNNFLKKINVASTLGNVVYNDPAALRKLLKRAGIAGGVAEELLDSPTAAMAGRRAVEDWFIDHRYDAIAGDVRQFLDIAAAQVSSMACLGVDPDLAADRLLPVLLGTVK